MRNVFVTEYSKTQGRSNEPHLISQLASGLLQTKTQDPELRVGKHWTIAGR